MRFKRSEFVKAVENFEYMSNEFNDHMTLEHKSGIMTLAHSYGIMQTFSDCIEKYYNLIIEMTDCDEEGKRLIDYFFFDLEFGKNEVAKNILVSVDDEEYELENAENLWVILIVLENLNEED